MKKVIVFENRVIDIYPEDFVPFDIHPSAQWLDAPDDVQRNFTVDESGVFHDPDTRTDEEKLADAYKYLRQRRDAKLLRTDWWATSDRTMTAEQAAYRQALRDLPANTTDPENPVWPTKPE